LFHDSGIISRLKPSNAPQPGDLQEIPLSKRTPEIETCTTINPRDAAPDDPSAQPIPFPNFNSITQNGAIVSPYYVLVFVDFLIFRDRPHDAVGLMGKRFDAIG
jgi:hypothetical protein